MTGFLPNYLRVLKTLHSGGTVIVSSGHTLVMGETEAGVEAVSVNMINETPGQEVLMGYDCSIKTSSRCVKGLRNQS